VSQDGGSLSAAFPMYDQRLRGAWSNQGLAERRTVYVPNVRLRRRDSVHDTGGKQAVIVSEDTVYLEHRRFQTRPPRQRQRG